MAYALVRIIENGWKVIGLLLDITICETFEVVSVKIINIFTEITIRNTMCRIIVHQN